MNCEICECDIVEDVDHDYHCGCDDIVYCQSCYFKTCANISKIDGDYDDDYFCSQCIVFTLEDILQECKDDNKRRRIAEIIKKIEDAEIADIKVKLSDIIKGY
jgi:hypothetical protein